MRVLYVEDNPNDADLTRRMLARLAPQIELDVVDRVASALALLGESATAPPAYDVILLDLRLPDGDGLSVLEHVRRHELPLAVVVLTGVGNEELAVSALKAGADDYLAKRDDYLTRLPRTLETARERFLAQRSRAPQSIHVLYVEHHELDIDLTRRHLARHAPHIHLTVTHSALEALELLRTAEPGTYDVLLLDYRLPAMNALDLLKELKREPHLDIPVILVTGQGDEEVAVQALRLGAADYLVKHPGYLFQLPRTIENADNQARLRKERAALYASEARYRMLFEHAPVAIFSKDVAGRYTSANAVTVEAFGRDPVGHTDHELLPAANADALRAHDLMVMQDQQPRLLEERLQMPHGERIYLTRKTPLVDERGVVTGILGVSVDITERVRAEEESRENQLRFRELAQHIDQVFWLVEVASGRLLYLNPAFSRLFGYGEAEVFADPSLFGTIIEAEDRPRVCEAYNVAREGRITDVEFRTRRKDGTLVWVAGYTFPIYDDNGTLYRIGGLLRDITEQRRTSQYAHQQERLVAVGQMAAGIVHDFNNILAVITLYTQMLQLSTQSATQQRHLATIYEQAQHAAKLVQQILDFSRRAIVDPVQMEVTPFIKELVRLWQRTLPENIRVALHVEGEGWTVVADPSRLQQALMNMAINARDAMPNGGLLELALYPVVVGEKHAPPLPDMAPGRWLAIDVRDTGTGMTPEIMAHIFEPFFTTKPPGMGTGLGLAQVYGIVRQMGGHIQVESTPGVGSCFTIYLALSGTPPAPLPVQEGAMPAGAGQTVLLVEDEEALRLAMTEMLTELGYRVLNADNGRHALSILSARGDEIAIIISDLVMPDMGGLELLEAQRQQGNGASRVPMLLVSGYPLEDIESLQREYGAVGWLPKPFTMEQLAQRVAQVLHSATV